ncbi:type I polyketide synthase [Streptomyces sp. NRRL F-5193]|uniref:type I polyketide synthase n=1 Tax=Streptomyces sp. NRRL F-5193 TaxID=1463860 RepID=UPI0007C77B2B|nr:type I polyketide synthase [Streptomyces sp. NRRL F-5193]
MSETHAQAPHEDGGPEPVAIIGMGCRFAGGAHSPEEFWTMLIEGRDGVAELPEERWAAYVEASAENAAALRHTTRVGAFLDDVAGFDAGFFGILPREAEQMDPQHRLMLEVAWEALEHAGIPPHLLAGGDTGVYVGIGTEDYGRRLMEDLPRIEAWTGIGAVHCAAANRISYHLDLRGPSMAVDTACSASLVALHLACQALASGETSLAIAGGVNAMVHPAVTMIMDAAGACSPDGRSKSFDASADGYGRGEGAGALVLKRLSDAVADGDRVLAVVRGTGIMQDGKTNGIMQPSRDAQADLLRHTYRTAGIAPESVGYVEAHGTGTNVGDPIEASALSEVLSAGRPGDRPLLIGSVKTNIGHLEAGAGVAGVIKAVLALQHGEIPPSLNCVEPNPAIPWDTNGLKVVTEPTGWPASAGPRRAGVSGYGFGGTIGHVILEEPTGPAATAAGPAADAEGGRTAPWLFPLSGASRAALRDNAARLADWLDGTGATVPTGTVGHTLAARRSPLAHRGAVVAADRAGLVASLRSLAAGEEVAGVTAGTAEGTPKDAVWVFAGQGAQWIGMGRDLLAGEPAFARVIDELGPVYEAELGFTARSVLEGDTLEGPEVVQPVTYAVQVALAAVWRSLGLRPAAVVGHSIGELAAAVTAGGMSLLDGARLVCRRALMMRPAAGRGAMALVNLPFAEAEERLAGRSGVTAAISASPLSTVIAGSAAAVEETVRAWEAEGELVVRRVQADIAFHSSEMDPFAAALPSVMHDLTGGRPEVTFYSTSRDDPRADVDLGAGYWPGNLRNPVRFSQAITAAVEDGHRHFLEVSSHPIVSHSIGETLGELGVDDATVVGTLRRGTPDRTTLLGNLATLYCAGVDADPGVQFAGRELAELPGTAWQHQTYWKESRPGAGRRVRQHDPAVNTLLGGATRIAGSTPLWLWQTHLDEESRPYPGHHPVHNVEIIPAAVLMNTFLEALARAGVSAPDGRRPALVDVALKVPVAVTVPRDVQISYQDSTLRLSSRISEEGDQETEESWLTHTTASIDPAGGVLDDRFDLDAARARCAEIVSTDYVLERVAQIGVAGMGFPWEIQELRRGGPHELFAVIDTGEEATATWASLLDGAMTVTSVLFLGEPILRMPSHIARLALIGDPPRRANVQVRAAEGADGADTLDVVVADMDGNVIANVTGIRLTVLTGDPSATASPRQLVHEIVWRPLDLPAARPLDTVVAVGGHPDALDALALACAEDGLDFLPVPGPDGLDALAGRLTDTTAVLVAAASGTDPDDPARAAHDAAWELGRAVRLTAAAATGRPRIWSLTTGVRESADRAALAQSPAWGMGRIAAAEHPDLWGGIVDLDPAAPDAYGPLLDVVRARPEADVIAIRDGLPVSSVLLAVDGAPERGPVACRPEGTYLVTGGLGALGLEVARWLAGRGARRLVLAGRRPFPERSEWDAERDPAVRAQIEAVRALEGLGVTVAVVSVDVSDPEQARKALSPTELGLPPIRGVVHAAGVVDGQMIDDLDEEALRAVLRPKVTGALVLDELFPAGSVDFMVLFSSCGYLFRFPGQASYGSANAFLDALARHRRAGGHDDTVSFGWTSWRGLGMSASSDFIAAELAAFGQAEISATEALRAWEYAERFGASHYAVFRQIATGGAPRRIPLTRELAAVGDGTDGDAAETRDWTRYAPGELLALLVDEVRREVAGEIKLAPEELELQRPLLEMGLDSVMTVAVRRRLERLFGLTLPATLLWNRPTVQAIAEYLVECLLPEGADEDADAGASGDDTAAPAARVVAGA